jgi:hypothetical protein
MTFETQPYQLLASFVNVVFFSIKVKFVFAWATKQQKGEPMLLVPCVSIQSQNNRKFLSTTFILCGKILI